MNRSPHRLLARRKAMVIDQLNGENNPRLGLTLGKVTSITALVFLTICMIAVDVFGEWIDSKGQIIGFILVMVGLVGFTYWVFIGRK
jgi:hypothetical protein